MSLKTRQKKSKNKIDHWRNDGTKNWFARWGDG